MDPVTGNKKKWSEWADNGGLKKLNDFYGLEISQVTVTWGGKIKLQVLRNARERSQLEMQMRDIGLAFFFIGLAMLAHSLFFFEVDLVLGLFENPLQLAEKQKIFRVGLAIYAVGLLILFRSYLTRKNVGLALWVAGGALCIYALFLFETTVSFSSGDFSRQTVYNLGLLNDRTNMIIASGIMILAGLFLWKD